MAWEQDDIDKWEKHLFRIRYLFADHILNVHAGVPATACHKCGNFECGIAADLENINEARLELQNREGKK